MILECKKCGQKVDSDAEDTVWVPPRDSKRDLAGIKCPNCGNEDDLSDWKLLTNEDSLVSKDSE